MTDISGRHTVQPHQERMTASSLLPKPNAQLDLVRRYARILRSARAEGGRPAPAATATRLGARPSRRPDR
jgi:hypothetical protein